MQYTRASNGHLVVRIADQPNSGFFLNPSACASGVNEKTRTTCNRTSKNFPAGAPEGDPNSDLSALCNAADLN